MPNPVIIDIAFEEMFPRMAQCGYRHVVRVRDDIVALKGNMPSPVTAHIAQVSGHPPLFMVKGPLFAANELGGKPQVEYVVTITQAFPNSYPILTIEGPPQGWSFKRHPNVDQNGCCFLQSVSRWDPRSSHVLNCVRELQGAFRSNHPFQSNASPQPTPQRTAQPTPQAPPQQPTTQAPPQQNAPNCTPAPLGAESIAMPPQTLAMGTMIFGATNASNGRTDPEIQRQREADQRWLADFHRRQPQTADPTNRAFQTNVAAFNQMLGGSVNRPGVVVDCPLGFGINRIVTASDPSYPLKSADGVPPPLPPCDEPTPDEQYKLAEQQRGMLRVQRDAHAQSQPKSTSTFGSISRAFNIGATAVSNLASQAASSVEGEIRKSEASHERRRFAQLFPQFSQEQFIVEYPCWSLMGSGMGVQGLVFITTTGVHFTSKKTDNLNPTAVVFQFDISFNQVASIAKGSALSYEWLHLLYDDGQFRTLYNVTTTAAASIGEVVTTSLRGTPYSRMYNWLDHMWRAVRFRGGNAPGAGGPPPPQVVQAPPRMPQESDQCVVCMERPKNQFFQPCGHVCCCGTCSQNMRECPLCRAPVQNSFQAFL